MGAAETVSLEVPSKSSRKADCTGEIKQAKCQWMFGLFPQTTICWNRLRRRRLEEPHRIAQVWGLLEATITRISRIGSHPAHISFLNITLSDECVLFSTDVRIVHSISL
jgi:hypothetical protein